MTEEKIILKYIPLPDAIGWESNPKEHDLGKLISSIGRYGFVSPPKFDSTINDGKPGLVFGNGRTHALKLMFDSGMPPPRGIIVDDDGVWNFPVIFGIDQDSPEVAMALAIDHNNLTLTGGEGFSALDMTYLYDRKAYLGLLRNLANSGQEIVTVDKDDIDFLLRLMIEQEFPAVPLTGSEGSEQDTEFIIRIRVVDPDTFKAVGKHLRDAVEANNWDVFLDVT